MPLFTALSVFVKNIGALQTSHKPSEPTGLLHIKCGNPNYFSDRLPANQHWRFFPEYRGSTAYIDVEKTGIKVWGFEIITIALYNGQSIYYYINGQNLDDFLTEVSKYSVIVTYSGKAVDIPLIEEHFGITLNHTHIDLRYVLASLGYTGGLEICALELGIDLGDLIGFTGYFSAFLWYDYVRTGNQKALETLLAYNIQEAVTWKR